MSESTDSQDVLAEPMLDDMDAPEEGEATFVDYTRIPGWVYALLFVVIAFWLTALKFPWTSNAIFECVIGFLCWWLILSLVLGLLSLPFRRQRRLFQRIALITALVFAVLVFITTVMRDINARNRFLYIIPQQTRFLS